MRCLFIDLTGMQFERLSVVKRGDDYISPKGNKYVRYLCQCNCSNPELVLVLASDLKAGKVKSCGCLNREKIIERNTKRNKYDLSGEYGIGWTSNTNKEFYFDLEDYEKIKDYCWQESHYGYVVNKEARLHRLIMKTPDKEYNVDHMNHNLLDNRKSNLRVTTKSQNQMNCKLAKNNTSGVTGVSYNKEICKWVSYIHVNNKRITLGYFSDFDEAVKARLKAEEKYFKEYSYKNSINGGKQNGI